MADKSIEDAVADAKIEKDEAEAAAAGAIAEAETAKAAEAATAAATAAAALAEVESAKAKQSAATEISETKESLTWLKGNQESLASSLQEMRTELTESRQATGKILEAISLLSTPPKSETLPNPNEPLIADPKNAEEAARQEAEKDKSKSASPAKKGKLWT